MTANLLVLLLVIALVVFFGWLTYRALRAKRLWVKIAGGLCAGIVTLLLVVVAFYGAKGFIAAFFPGAPDAPELTVAATPEQVRRGEYLVSVACYGCHSSLDANGKPSRKPPLSGGYNLSEGEGFGFIGPMVTENLTPGGKLAGYSDGELFRALRHGVDKYGHLLGTMSYLPYNQLSDADTEAIVAYLRSMPAVVTNVAGGDKVNFLGMAMLGAGMFGEASAHAPESITAPPQAVTAEYGKYVATFGECRGCHGTNMTGAPATAVGPAIPNPRPLVGTLTQEQFIEMMRTGQRPGGKAFPTTMPYQNAAQMTDEDLAALYAFLIAPSP